MDNKEPTTAEIVKFLKIEAEHIEDSGWGSAGYSRKRSDTFRSAAKRLETAEQQAKVSAQCNRTAVEAVEALAAKHEAHVKAIQSELSYTSDTYAPDNMPYDVADLHERIGIILNRSGE